jgi:hypothetical protein
MGRRRRRLARRRSPERPFATEGGYIGRFHGGPGNDTAYGGTAADSYYFDQGDGQDTIFDEPLFSNGQWNYSFSDE